MFPSPLSQLLHVILSNFLFHSFSPPSHQLNCLSIHFRSIKSKSIPASFNLHLYQPYTISIFGLVISFQIDHLVHSRMILQDFPTIPVLAKSIFEVFLIVLSCVFNCIKFQI
ncbi:hypothetical protein DFH28DRAFT_986831 [Melampsora americana]|nr:hypothetical protein DFH28DRAFT_986823 [Melampsora americana]KAH9809999.1 hypothetical protein DFH28DRAFT_986827 [Melampsora americana]KAH9810000.1 hypothetical protein DFH28DRAFT_986831 [Melampsora americana]